MTTNNQTDLTPESENSFEARAKAALVQSVPNSQTQPISDAADVILKASAIPDFSDFELSLEDKYIVEKKTEPAAVFEQKAESRHLPNVLVDAQLMEEISSIPDRFGFKIGDVADLLDIKQYVLRYWEQEFELLKPKKASNNQRLYTKKDVENAFLIRKLLYRDKFSIEGARQALKDVKFAVKKEKDFNSVIQKIDFVQEQIKSFVDDIKRTKDLFN